MKLSTILFAFFAFPTFVTSIPLLDSTNNGYDNVGMTTKRLNEQNIDRRELSPEMYDIVVAIDVYANEYNHGRGYSRSDFTQNVVQALRNKDPHFNYIICHTDHIYDFGSPWGVNVYNVWVIYDDGNLFRPGHGFDVVVGKNGTFTRYGDGGFQNWAYNGNIKSTDTLDYGVIVTFDTPN